MYEPESVLDNEMHKNLWYFEIETDNLLSARLDLELIITKKRNLLSLIFCHSKGPLRENKRKQKDK